MFRKDRNKINVLTKGREISNLDIEKNTQKELNVSYGYEGRTGETQI
jgi:outer membrane lipopolysaccharide assembly protein LptE/RlpB